MEVNQRVVRIRPTIEHAACPTAVHGAPGPPQIGAYSPGHVMMSHMPPLFEAVSGLFARSPQQATPWQHAGQRLLQPTPQPTSKSLQHLEVCAHRLDVDAVSGGPRIHGFFTLRVARPHLTGMPTDYHFDTAGGFLATLSSVCIAHPKLIFSTHCFIWIFHTAPPPTELAQALLVIRPPPSHQ